MKKTIITITAIVVFVVFASLPIVSMVLQVLAYNDGICTECGGHMVATDDIIVFHENSWVHCHCDNCNHTCDLWTSVYVSLRDSQE